MNSNEIELAYRYKLPSTEFELSMLREAVINNNIPLDSVLDVGCGVGWEIDVLENLGARGLGIDLNEEIIVWLKKRRSSNFNFRQQDFLSLNPLPLNVSLIVMLAVLEHIKDDVPFVKKSFEMLRAGGYFIVVVPAHRKLYCRHDRNYGHFRRYDRQDLVTLLESQGFQIIDIFSYGLHLLQVVNSRFIEPQTIRETQAATEHSAFELPDWYIHYYPLLKLGLCPYNSLQRLFKTTNWGNAYFIISRRPEC